MPKVAAGRVLESKCPNTLLSEWGTEAQDQRGMGPNLPHQLAAGSRQLGQELWVGRLWFFHHQAAVPRQF